MSVIVVSNASALSNALAHATAGETIELAPGTYSGVNIANFNQSSAVTITSEYTGNQAVLQGLKVCASSNLNFTNLNMTSVGVSDPYYGFRVANSKNITFSNVNAHGDTSQAPSTQLNGFYVTGSDGVKFQNSTFAGFVSAITANNDSNIAVSGNTFTNLDKGGVEMGAVTNVSITGNAFTNFAVAAGTHADAVQIYTAGTTTSSSNLNISDNLITRGSGDAIQGIFVQDEVGNLPYNNLTINNNVVLGEMWDSIWVHGNVTGNLTLTNNVAESWAGVNKEGTGDASAMAATSFATTNFLGQIVVNGVTSATVNETGNIAQSYLGNGGAVIAPPTGNTQIGVVAAITGPVSAANHVGAVSVQKTLNEYQSVSGNALTGVSGSGISIVSAGASLSSEALLGANGATITGKYGPLHIAANGAYTYSETATALTAGQTYSDSFSVTVGASTGLANAGTLTFQVAGSATGNGQADTLAAALTAVQFSGFGAGSTLTAGSGLDVFAFNSVSQSTVSNQTTIKGMSASDVINLAGISPSLHLVSKFDGKANEVVLSHLGTGNWEVMVDTTGHGAANFEVHLLGFTPSASLGASNFVF